MAQTDKGHMPRAWKPEAGAASVKAGATMEVTQDPDSPFDQDIPAIRIRSFRPSMLQWFLVCQRSVSDRAGPDLRVLCLAPCRIAASRAGCLRRRSLLWNSPSAENMIATGGRGRKAK